MYDVDGMVEVVRAGLSTCESALRAEQAVYGLDALDEVAWHPLVAAALSDAGYGVLREQVYPNEWRRKDTTPRPALDAAAADGLPKPRDRRRCDLVLTPRPGLSLRDPLAAEQGRRTARREAAGSLFEARALSELAIESDEQFAPAGQSIAPEEAYWLELKVVGQYTFTHGTPGPNRAYASELMRGIAADARKLAGDGMIVHAGVLLVLLCSAEDVASHDVITAVHACLDQGLPVVTPRRADLAIGDRIGNRLCSLWWVPVRT